MDLNFLKKICVLYLSKEEIINNIYICSIMNKFCSFSEGDNLLKLSFYLLYLIWLLPKPGPHYGPEQNAELLF